MGDNRPQSQDSRFFGPIDRELIVGRAWLRYFPLDRIGFMNRPEYEGLPSGTDAEAVTRPPQLLAGSSATIQVSMARP
jgi:signal peptidase I